MSVQLVRAQRRLRRYDKSRGCYVYDVSFSTKTPLTERTVEVTNAFGIGLDQEHRHVLYEDFELKLADGDVVYITGDSGSGKSVLLKALAEDLGAEATVLDQVTPMEGALVDTVGESFSEAIGILSRVGLNDAFLFLKEYSHLSEGQRYRYLMARLIDEGRKYWLCDEFCSTLDRITAKIVAFNMQKQARRAGVTLIVATTHTDLEEDLNPSIVVRKGWGKELTVDYRSNLEAPSCSVVKDMRLCPSNRMEYNELAYLHYRSHKVPVPREFYCLRLGEDIVGVIAYSYPPLLVKGRIQAVGYRPLHEEINREWSQVSRVIIHPKYRSIGLGSHIVRESLRAQGCRHVELTAVMAMYNPFAEKAGMKLIVKAEPDRRVLKVIDKLAEYGFNPLLLSSRSTSKAVLEALEKGELENVKTMLSKVGSIYLRRLSRAHAYVNRAEFIEWVMVQDLDSLAWTLETLSTLAQTKAYFYWCRDWLEVDLDAL